MRNDDRLTQLVRRLALENAVPIHTWEPNTTAPDVLPPFSLAAGSPDEVVDRLYPPAPDNRRVGDEKQRLQLRDEFIGRATELLDDKARRIGLATLWKDMYFLSRRNFQGIVTVNGLLTDESVSFSGSLAGQPSRASRDRARLIADQDQVRLWMRGQEQHLRAIRLPEDWVLISTWVLNPPLSEVFPAVTNRDPAYEYARNHTAPTWQKEWWRLSGSPHRGLPPHPASGLNTLTQAGAVLVRGAVRVSHLSGTGTGTPA